MGTTTEGPINSVTDVCSRHWILWASSTQGDSAAVHENVDKIFSKGFSFYPEKEWRSAGFPPPEGHEVLGAWRDPAFKGFAFLLDNHGMKDPPGTVTHLLTYQGSLSRIVGFIPQIEQLKKSLAQDADRKKNDKRLRTRLNQADVAASFRRLLTLSGSVTAMINLLALYLRKLPPPSIQIPALARFYEFLVPSVYISALLLLLLFAIIFFLFTTKYAILLLRKL